MANHKSAKKRAIQSEKKRKRNKAYLSAVRTQVKVYKTALHDLAQGKGEKAQVEKLLSSAQASLHKAASKGIIHRNNASRKVGRLAAQLKVCAAAKA